MASIPSLTGMQRKPVQAGAALVGIDSITSTTRLVVARPTHSILLAAGHPIVEHLCEFCANSRLTFTIFAVPVKVKRLGTFSGTRIRPSWPQGARQRFTDQLFAVALAYAS